MGLISFSINSSSLFIKKYIYLAAQGLSCCYLWPSLQPAGSLGVECKLCMWDLVSWPGIKPRALYIRVTSFSHWTTRKSQFFLFKLNKKHMGKVLGDKVLFFFLFMPIKNRNSLIFWVNKWFIVLALSKVSQNNTVKQQIQLAFL